MCTFCRSVAINRRANGGYLTEDQTKLALDIIATRMEAGDDPEHFQLALDNILETEMAERDPEIEAAWEAKRKSDG